MKNSMRFSLVFANNTILQCFFSFFLITDLYFLILAVIAQIFNSMTELLVGTGIATKEAKAEMEAHPETSQTKIGKC